MKKLILIIMFVLLSFGIVYGADSCKINENCTWYAYGVTGDGVNITFSYPNETTTEEFEMILIETGKYLYTTTHNITSNILGCARSYNSTDTIAIACESKEIYDALESEDVGNELEAKVILFALIMLPLIFGIILMAFGFSLDKTTHPVMKLFLSLLSIPMYWTSLNFGVMASSKYLGFVELENAMSFFTNTTGLLFVVIMAYFIIYLVYTMINYSAQKKEEKLKY